MPLINLLRIIIHAEGLPFIFTKIVFSLEFPFLGMIWIFSDNQVGFLIIHMAILLSMINIEMRSMENARELLFIGYQ